MEIGVIDTGVDRNHRRLRNCTMDGITIKSSSKSKFQYLKNSFEDEDGHGTGVASIIHRHCPQAKLRIVKLASDDGFISEELLCQGITYLLDFPQVRIINISMGIHTSNPTMELEKACEKAYEKGIIVNASSYYHAEKPCYPAHFTSVYGVGVGLIKSKKEFKFLKNNPTNILAKGGFQRIANTGDTFKFGSGTSLATAHFSGLLASHLSEMKTVTPKSLKKWLKENSNEAIISFNRRNADDKIAYSKNDGKNKDDIINDVLGRISIPNNAKRLALFPFIEKEMKSIIQFSDLSRFSVKLAIDFPRTVKLDKDYETLIAKNDIPITSTSLNQDELDSFDTLVLGYFLDQMLDRNLIFGYDLIKTCLCHNKNFVVWDDTVYKLITKMITQFYPDYSGNISSISIDREFARTIYSTAPFPEIKAPTLCVIGTGSYQGKFTVQMNLKRLLESLDYKLSLIATEPQGLLFDADFIFPFGYNPPIHVNTGEWGKLIRLIFQLVNKVKRPEIFLTGSQGGVIPRYPINEGIAGAQLKQLNFIQSVYPDAVICTISPHDSVDFIKKTITVVQAYVKCEVIFYALTPFTYKGLGTNAKEYRRIKLSPLEYQNKLQLFSKELGKPVLDITDRENDGLIIELIQNTFSNEYREII